jgi:hypothetical protein
VAKTCATIDSTESARLRSTARLARTTTSPALDSNEKADRLNGIRLCEKELGEDIGANKKHQ